MVEQLLGGPSKKGVSL